MNNRAKFGIAFVFTAALASAGLAPPVAAAGPPTQPLAPISSDPYTNPTSQHATEVEPHVLSEGSTIIAAFQVGRFHDGGASDIGWSRSINDGVSWTPGYLPGLTTFEAGGTYASASDPTVAFDAAHNVWMITSLGLYPGPTPGTFADQGDVVTSRSVDGGLTWNSPVMIGGNGVQNLDKPWVVCDNTSASPYYGHCYATYDDFGNHSQVAMSTSADGGLTWSTPVATADVQRGLGGVPVVQPAGKVIVPLLGPGSIDVFSSSNGGASWSGTTHIARIRYFSGTHTAQEEIRASPLPASAIDASGRVFVVWSDCRFSTNCRRNDVVLSSSDNGVKWSAVRRMPLDTQSSATNYVGPAIAIDPATSGAGTAVALTTYAMPHPSCGASRCRVAIDFASSTDRGKHWTRGSQIAGGMHLKWAPATTNGYMFGDYFAVAVSSDGAAVPVESVAHAAVGAFDQAINSGRLAIEAGTFRTAAASRSLSRTGRPPSRLSLPAARPLR